MEVNGSGWYLAADGVQNSRLQVESWVDYGGPTTPGVYTIEDVSYADCGLCVVAGENVDDSGATLYYATEGTVEIVSLDLENGGPLEMVLRDVVLTEVTYDDAYDSTPVDGGGTWCVDTSLTGEIEV